MSSTTSLTQRRSAIPTRRSRNTNATPSSGHTVRRHDHAGQVLTTFRDLEGAGVSGGFFVNTTGPVSFYNEGEPSSQPLNSQSNIPMGTNGNTHPTQDFATPGPSQNAEYDIYYNQLLVKRRGTPLWEPGPQMMFPMEYRRNGVSIGDVGIVYRTGDFAFLFNIFLPANHEINQGRVPNGFIPLDKSKVEKTIKKCVVYDRGSCLASSSLRRTDSPDFAFQTTGSEGAVLVMPDGALSEDLRNHKLVEKYIADNAKSWYEYVESDNCGMQTENGDIRVVVGMDKVSSWGMATFENVSVEEPLQFEFKDDGRSSQAPTYKWDRIVAGRAGPPEEEIRDLMQGPHASPIRNQCVFVRTLNVSVAGKVRDESAVYEVRASCFRDSTSDSSRQQGPSGQRNVNLQASQIGQPVSHPSNFLNKCLLQKCPNAEVVITKDSDWISVITENDVTTPSFEDLCARVLASHTICEKEGVVTLKKRKNIFNTGSYANALTVRAHQQTTSEDTLPMGNEREAYVIGRLFLNAPDDPSLTESPNNNLMKKHIDDKLHQIADPASCFIKSSFDDGGNDVHCTKKSIDDRERTSIFASAHFQCAEKLSFDFNRDLRRRNGLNVTGLLYQLPRPPDTDHNFFYRPTRARDRLWSADLQQTPATLLPHSFTVAAEQDQNPAIQETSRGKVQTGCLPTTPTLPSPLSRNRGENLITDPPKPFHKLLIEYHTYPHNLEALLDCYAQTSILSQRSKDFRLDRPKDPDDLLGLSMTLGESEEDNTTECYDSENTNILLWHDLSALVEPYNGISSPFRFRSDPLPVPSRFPTIVEDPEQTYVLVVGSDTNYNPPFDWSHYLPSAVALDRGSHNRALHDLFRYCTSFCLRLIPDLFLKDMYRVLSVQRSQELPKTVHYSPMLHSSLVAFALAFSDDPRFHDLKARQYFIDVAKAYMESECQKPTLAVVQALSFLGTFYGSQGDQGLGFMYFGLSARMAQVLGLDVDCSVYVERKLMDHPDTLMIDRNWTAWSIFTSDVCWSLYVGREFATTVPDDDFPLPYIDEKLDEMPVAYGNPTPQPNHTTKTFQSCASLPPDLQLIIKNRSPATPHKLLLHLSFWWLFVLLHRPPFHYRTSMEAGRQIDHVKLCKRAADSVMEILKSYKLAPLLDKIPRNNDNQVTILNPGIKEDEYSPSHRGRGRPRQKSPENKRKQSVQWRGGPSGSQLIPQQPPFSLPIPITAASPPKHSNTIPILILTTFRHQSESNVSSFVIEPPDAQTSSTSSSPKVAADILTENFLKKLIIDF